MAEGHNLPVIGDTGPEEGCIEIKMTLSEINESSHPQGRDIEDLLEY